MSIDKLEKQFVDNAIEMGVLTREQLDKCIVLKNKHKGNGKGKKPPLWEIAVTANMLDAEKVKEVVAYRPASSAPASPAPASAAPVAEKAPKSKEIGGFELITKIGQGGMGAVYKARQKSVDRIVALKILPPSLAKDKSFIQRFLREARASAALNHPNIVRGIDVGEDAGYHYFAMEFIEGETAGDILKRDAQMAENQAIDITIQMAKALQHADEHKMVHRDIKPANILIDSRGLAKLVDLGLARQVGQDASVTQSGIAMGTPFYISPEQARGEQDIDIRADIYSLGATLYHFVTGRPPFEGPTGAVIMTKHLTESLVAPEQFNDRISRGLSAIIKKAMEKEREERYQTPKDLVFDLELVRSGNDPINAMQAKESSAQSQRPAPSRKPSSKRKKSTVPILAGMAAAIVIAGIVLVVILSKKPEQPDYTNGDTAIVDDDNGGTKVKPQSKTQPNPDPDPGTNPDPGSNPDPGPGPGQDPEAVRKKELEEARGKILLAMEEAEEKRKDIKDIPEDYLFLIETYEKLVEKAKSYNFEDLKTKCIELKGVCERELNDESNKAFESAKSEAKKIRDSAPGDLLAVMETYLSVSEKFQGTKGGREAEDIVAKLKEEMSLKYLALKREAQEAESKDDYARAYDLWDDIGRVAYNEDIKKESNDAIRVLREKENQRNMRAYQLYHADFIKSFFRHMKALDIKEAEALAKKFFDNPECKPLKSNLENDMKDAQALAAFFNDIETLCQQYARDGKTIVKYRFMDSYVEKVENGVIYFTPVESGSKRNVQLFKDIKINDPKTYFSETELRDLLLLMTAEINKNKKLYMHVKNGALGLALFAYYTDPQKLAVMLKGQMDEWKQLKLDKDYQAHLEARFDYIRQYKTIELANEALSAATSKYLDAMNNISSKKMDAAKVDAAIAALQQWLAKYGDTDIELIAARIPDVEKMKKTIIEASEASLAVLKPLLNPASMKAIGNDVVSLLYDFEDTKKQLSDFQGALGVDDSVDGRIVSRGKKTLFLMQHKARFTGDIEIVARVKFGEGDFIRIDLDDNFNRASLQQSRRDKAVPGFLIFKNKYYSPNGKEHVFNVPNEEFSLEIARYSNKVIMKINGKIVAEETYEYKYRALQAIIGGRVSDGYIEEVNISGIIDQDWLDTENKRRELRKDEKIKLNENYNRGLRLKLFSDDSFTKVVKTGEVHNMTTRKRDQNGQFFVECEGYLLVGKDGTYRIVMRGECAFANLYIADMDNPVAQGKGEFSEPVKIELKAGLNKIKLRYISRDDNGVMMLLWKNEDNKEPGLGRVMNADNLYYKKN